MTQIVTVKPSMDSFLKAKICLGLHTYMKNNLHSVLLNALLEYVADCSPEYTYRNGNTFYLFPHSKTHSTS